MNDPDIVIVEACIPKPGDTIVICTKESLSLETLQSMRGRVAEYFKNSDVNVIIIAADQVFLLRDGETLDEYYHKKGTS